MRRADALRDELEQDIVTGTLRPGERLDEQTLAARFGVSRTPIREALMQLASAGLIQLQPRRGAFVASLSLREVIERFEVMAALEGACGALAARRLTDEERARLLEAHEACIHEAPRGDTDTQLRARSRVATSLAEHQAVVDAVLAGDGERAERALKDHILIQGDRLSDFIASFNAGEVA
jgi:DNA-binding GntR family transcriptional regulator